MRNLLIALVAVALPCSAMAALPVGARAPEIRTVGAIGGKTFKLDLHEQLREAPVVLYFFPKAFTQGCTLEAHAFSEAMPEFRKAGAQVIGMSADDIGTLRKFSVEECRSAFAVATARPPTIRAYDVALKKMPGLTARTSYVIGRDPRIAMVHNDLDCGQHVARTVAPLPALK